MKNLNGFLLIARAAFAKTLRGQRALALIALCLLPLGMALIFAQKGAELDEYIRTLIMFVLQVSVPFGALLLGTAVLGDEIDGRTITYLFTRPLPRSLVFAGRVLGFALAYGLMLAGTVAGVAWIHAASVPLTAVQVAASAGIAVAGMGTYLAFFATLRAIFKKSLYIGFAIAFIVEGFISKLPGVGGLARISVWHHMAVLTARLLENEPNYKMPEATRVDFSETAQGSLTVMGVIFVVSLVLGMRLAKSREFHVPAAVG